MDGAFPTCFLDARGGCLPARKPILSARAEAERLLARFGAAVSLDVVLRAVDWLPEGIRCSGVAAAPGVIVLYLRPEGVADSIALWSEVLRVLLPEGHHVLRWGGPGYGRSLGEALVSEGMAQLFVHHLLDIPPEPWEFAVDEAARVAHPRDSLDGFGSGYDHSAWFMGKGCPCWLGYALGRRIVGARPGDTTAYEARDWPVARFRAALKIFTE